jgi:hypothetical protein
MTVKGTEGERKGAILLRKYGLNREDKITGSGIWKRMLVSSAGRLSLLKATRKYDSVKLHAHSKESAPIVKEPIYFGEIA